MAKPTNEWDIRQGGLMRCCIKTLVEEESSAIDGDTRHCKYCNATMVLRAEAWEWRPNRNEDL